MIASFNYLENLTNLLHHGAMNIPSHIREKHVRYILSCQNPDGGFIGRDPESDLYYTGFALRSLLVLNALDNATCEKVGVFLSLRLNSQTSLVDFFSLVYSAVIVSMGGGPDVFASSGDWTNTIGTFLASLRCPDGGFGKVPSGKESSTYMSFLALLCHQLIGKKIESPEKLVGFVLSRHREDGGFVEYGPMRKSGTNPTAAGMGILRAISPSLLRDEMKINLVKFYKGMIGDENGFKANHRIPFCDVLSTFTSLWSLRELDSLDEIPGDKIHRYIMSTENPQGGFHGGSWDAGKDVEYSFYALGALALLAPRGQGV
jgi:geranylgeranyl transferase type-2 subunit beta